MAAGGWRNWAQGELVTEALFQDIQDSIAFIYASESAANTALTNKVEGTQFYDTGEDKLKIWNGSAWVAVGGGITEADSWNLTANITSDGFITSNLARPTGTAQSYLGTGMTESSGVFTFPSSGYWLVTMTGGFTIASGDSFCQFEAHVSSDSGSSYDQITEIYDGSGSGTSGGNATISVVLDITDASTHRIKFLVASLSGGSSLNGNTIESQTNFTFLRLADT